MSSGNRLVRRQPLMQRLKAYLDPLDFLLWLSEELETSDWEEWQKEWATPIGVGLNLMMLIARANTGGVSSGYDDVFADDTRRGGWLAWLATFMVHTLSLFSFANAVYTFYRKRHYRLFETSVETTPTTPSAHRVRVDSSPVSSSPLRFLRDVLDTTSVQSRVHPDAQKDVWELSVWDPTPLCLKMYCLFSPGHVLIYWFFLPTSPHDARPSTTVAIALALATFLSAQLTMLQRSFSQQSKDTSLIHKEVLNEYDTKYVHPRTRPQMRDVGTQYKSSTWRSGRISRGDEAIETFAPVTIVNKGFQTQPNPNYVSHVDPDAHKTRETPTRVLPRAQSRSMTPAFEAPAQRHDFSSPIQPRTGVRRPQYRASAGPYGGDGGNLGVYSHAHSPLKKATSYEFYHR